MKIIASFDDGSAEDVTISAIMRKYDIETIFYFPAYPLKVNEPFGRMSLDHTQRQRIADHHEIGSHTLTHQLLTRVDKAVAWQEIYESRNRLEEEFQKPIKAFCYPRGYANAELQKMVQDAGYKHARGVTVGYLDIPENPFYEQTTVHVGCDRKEYGGRGWYRYALDMIDQSQEDSIYHLWGHGWEIAKNQHNFDLLDDLCAELTRRNSDG